MSTLSDDPGREVTDLLAPPLLARLQRSRSRPFLYGLCGAQGSGKSTAAKGVQRRLATAGFSAAILSIDDLYLSGERRAELARTVHPLLRTRGVPGTHELAPAWTAISAAAEPGPFRLPRFDKASDEPCAPEAWAMVQGPVDVLILEGWCVGASPQAPASLVEPGNALERDEDTDGRWRTWVNAQLAGGYQRLFARIDMLAMIAAPDFDVVAAWRREQEHALRRSLEAAGRDASRTLSDEGVERFVQHYERITRHMLDEMPGRADVVVRLDKARRPIG